MAIGYGRRLAARSAVRLTLAVASCLTCARADQATQDTVVGAVGCVPGPFTPPQYVPVLTRPGPIAPVGSVKVFASHGF